MVYQRRYSNWHPNGGLIKKLSISQPVVSKNIENTYTTSTPVLEKGDIIYATNLIKSNSNVTYEGSLSITLGPNFTVEPGTQFRAYMSDSELKYAIYGYPFIPLNETSLKVPLPDLILLS